MADIKTMDCRGLACPQPVILTRQQLDAAEAPFQVLVDNQGSCTNVQRFAESQGAGVAVQARDGDFLLTIEPAGGVPATEPRPAASEAARPESDSAAGHGTVVVYVASEVMGRGDDELGGVLMAAFLDTLSHFKDRVSHAVLVNSGAKLAVRGSAVLDQLRQLEEMGTVVLVCGTCLNHFGLAGELAAGRVSNMYEIIDTLAAAERIIRP